jgi:mannose-6-phosphate isomerase-like protein (cupin superfamily)
MKNFVWSVLIVAGFGTMGGVAVAQTLDKAQVFPFDQMPVSKMANGGESRSIVHGVLAGGEVVGLHESVQPVGAVPNAAHVIEHTEFIVVVTGTVDFLHDGKAERVGPGGVILVAPGTMHTLKNVGDVPARYVVVAIGGDTKK